MLCSKTNPLGLDPSPQNPEVTLSKPYINPALCSCCGTCPGACPVGTDVIRFNATMNTYVIDASRCLACMACQGACPTGAPTLLWSGMTNITCPSCGKTTWKIDDFGNIQCTTCNYKPYENQ